MRHVPHILNLHYDRRMLAKVGGGVVLAAALIGAVQVMPENLPQQLREMSYVTAVLAYFASMLVVTVIAPLGILPMVPAIALILGPWQTAALSVVGWTVGAVIAFLIARAFGKPLIRQFISLEKIERYERRLPTETSFWGLVVLRIFVPVDILSYAIGLVSRMPLWQYTLATLLGVIPASIFFSYVGYAVTTGDYGIVAGTAVLIAGIGFFTYRSIHRRRNDRNHEVTNSQNDT